jgi:hypothetical protein
MTGILNALLAAYGAPPSTTVEYLVIAGGGGGGGGALVAVEVAVGSEQTQGLLLLLERLTPLPLVLEELLQLRE